MWVLYKRHKYLKALDLSKFSRLDIITCVPEEGRLLWEIRVQGDGGEPEYIACFASKEEAEAALEKLVAALSVGQKVYDLRPAGIKGKEE